MKSKTGLRVVCVASDGESHRGSAFVLLTFCHKLQPISPLYPSISCLTFMDLYVGDDDLTADKDWKHIFKRFRNLLLRARGVLVSGIRITPSIIESHLKMSGLSATHVHTLFHPDDEQDVKLAFDLLKAIWSLPVLTEHRNPSVIKTRKVLRTLGKLLYHMVFPYLCVDLSLSEQLEHFSAAAHLVLILYRAAGKDFLPTLLYIDLQIMIKNIFFCVGKAKLDNPHGKFHVILLGTDRLEELFGILRTMIGSDANLDMWQLASRLTGTTLVSNILAKYPQWDRAPRRLKLPAITRDSDELPSTSDHIKPASWRGDVYVKNVTLQTAWNRGRRSIEEECPFTRPLFLSLEATQVTILAPFTKLLVGGSSVDEDDDSQGLGNTPMTMNTASGGTPSPSVIDTQAEVEDAFISAEDTPSDEPLVSSKYDRHILYGGKRMLKSRALSLFSRRMGKTTPSSTDRLKRVQEVERYGKGVDYQLSNSGLDPAEDVIVIQDPVGTLVRCEENIFLCIGEVNAIKIDSSMVSSVSLCEIAEADSAKITMSISLLGLRHATEEDDPSLSADWRSYRMSGERTIHIPAKTVLPVDPAITTHDIRKVFYLLKGGFLVTLAASLFGSLGKEEVKKLPQVAINHEFPYCEETGMSFVTFQQQHIC